MTFIGVSQGAQPLISYYLGKKEQEKYKKLLRYSIITGIGFSVLCTVICYGFAGGIVSLFLDRSSADLAVYSVRVFRIFILSFLLAGFNIIIGGYFAAIENAGFATAISLTRGILALIVSLLILTALFGGEGIWWAPLAAEIICLMITLPLFYNNYKKSCS